MSRRRVLVASLLLAVLGCGVVPWSVPSARLAIYAGQALSEAFDLVLEADGPATVTVLPVPRLTFGSIALRTRDGTLLVQDGAFRGELALGPLLAGTLRFNEIALRHPRIHVGFDEGGGTGWKPVFARFAGGAPDAPRSSAHVERLVVSDGLFDIDARPAGWRTELSRANFVLRWPQAGGELAVAGSGRWRDETVALSLSGLHPFKLMDGDRDGIGFELAAKHAALKLTGDLAWTEGPSFAGLAVADIPSLSDFVRWSGLAPHLAGIDRPFSLSGQAALNRTGIDAPRVRLAVAGDALEGSLNVALGARPKVRATLAGGQIDLAWLARWYQDEGAARAEAEDGEVTAADYDLRFSAAGIRLGGLKLKDAAASLLIGRDRADLSLARAGVAEGTVKGRVSAGIGAAGRDVRGQLSLERVDLGALLVELGQAPVATGRIAGQVAFEAAAEPRAEVARRLNGRLNLTARDGELSGVTLADGRGRADARAEVARAWRGGRTPFETAQLSVTVANGMAEIADGSIDSGASQTILEGRLSLVDRFLSLKATTRTAPDAPTGRPALVLDVNGPWDRLVALPSAAPSVPR